MSEANDNKFKYTHSVSEQNCEWKNYSVLTFSFALIYISEMLRKTIEGFSSFCEMEQYFKVFIFLVYIPIQIVHQN